MGVVVVLAVVAVVVGRVMQAGRSGVARRVVGVGIVLIVCVGPPAASSQTAPRPPGSVDSRVTAHPPSIPA